MSLENVPVKETIEIETLKLNNEVLDKIKELNNSITDSLTKLGEIHIRRKELVKELDRIDELETEIEDKFNTANTSLTEELTKLNETYPGGRLDLISGTIQYQLIPKEN
jgi:archaellum component FlaC